MRTDGVLIMLFLTGTMILFAPFLVGLDGVAARIATTSGVLILAFTMIGAMLRDDDSLAARKTGRRE